MGVLRRLLRLWSSAGAKVLLFSYSVRMLDILEQVRHSAAESAPMHDAAAQRCGGAWRWCCR